MSNNSFSSLMRKGVEKKIHVPPIRSGTMNSPTDEMNNRTQSVYPDSSPNSDSLDYVSPRTAYNDGSVILLNDENLKSLNGGQCTSSENNQLSSFAPLNTPENYVYKNEGYSTRKSSDISAFSVDMNEAACLDSSHVTPENNNRNDLIKRVSNLDPGSSSTVSKKQFFGDNANSILPSRNRSESKSKQSSFRGRYSNPGFSGINLPENISPNDVVLNTKTTSQIQSPAPEIFVTDADNTSAPELPQKPPPLPNRPCLLPRNRSAHELPNDYSQNLSFDSQTHSSNFVSNSAHDLLSGIENFEGVIITEEIIRQQKEIEESIHRRYQEQNSTVLPPGATMPKDFVSNDVDSVSQTIEDGISIDSSNSDDVSTPRDVSQLEIPSSLFRSNSNGSETESDAGSSIILVDMFATGDITEEEFISLLPPVPEYTKIPRETELSIPNGKAIDTLQINESHPQEPPPDYTPLTRAMKQFISRPQFSQTGGDSQTYSRRQQQQIQQIERRMQQQEHMSAYYDLPSPREDSPEERNRLYFDIPPLPLRPIFYGARGIMLTDRNPYVRRVYPLNSFTNMYRRY